MTPDKDLQFLQFSSNEDLLTLCNILTLNSKGEYRINEKLTGTESYINCYPENMQGMWKDLAYELQSFGGNTILNVFTRNGRGPAYESIVSDVCRKIGIKVPRHAECTEMEQLLLNFFTNKALNSMTEAQLRAVCDDLGITYKNKVAKTAMIAAIIASRRVSTRAYIFVLRLVISFVERVLVGRTMMYFTWGLTSRSLGILTGPVGMAALTGWTVWDIAGPAYRVTIPAVLQIAMMRVEYNLNKTKEEVA